MNEILNKIKFLKEIKGRMSNIEREIGLVYDLIIKEAQEGQEEIELFEKTMSNEKDGRFLLKDAAKIVSAIGYRGED